MATLRLNATGYNWGSSSYNSSTNIKVGKTGSSSSDGTKYRGRVRFNNGIGGSWVISKITLTMQRIDSYSSHVLEIGVSSSNAWGASLQWKKNFTFSSGTGNKTIDITAAKDIIQGYTGTYFYIHILHGSGTNSYSEFKGSSTTPYITITYEEATVYYYGSGNWQQCLVYYYTGGQWVQCIPYYYTGGSWIQV
ncbi:hypothetical protein LJC33_02520 [Eubacteriales bacterium OttesenSCG-928-N13]|nr:hypothetical protein [Eubacteriales bacterium OttesenSCG-928-N13]